MVKVFLEFGQGPDSRTDNFWMAARLEPTTIEGKNLYDRHTAWIWIWMAKRPGVSSDLFQVYSNNVWCNKFRSKHISNTVLCLLRNSMHQTLLGTYTILKSHELILRYSYLSTFIHLNKHLDRARSTLWMNSGGWSPKHKFSS